MMSDRNKSFLTLGSLIKKDLQHAYYLPGWPSTYSPHCRFQNNVKYRLFDYDQTASKVYNDVIVPCRNLLAVGNEVPVLSDYHPPSFLKEHWKTWLPDVPDVNILPISQGLQDDKPIVTNTAIQSLPKSRHSVDPDVLYKVQSKSSIPDVGVPCPKYFPTEDAVSFPCMVKVDMSKSGHGNRVAYNRNEFDAIIKEIRDTGWTGNIVFQEFIEDVKDVAAFQFYLHASGEMYWFGAGLAEFDGFNCTKETLDWNKDKQEEYRMLLHDEFAVPIKDYLHKQGYFGLVMSEVLLCDHGKYLVDLNPRVSGDTTHVLLADYLAKFGFPHSFLELNLKMDKSAEALVERANHINKGSSSGRVIIVAAADVEENKVEFEISIFAKSAKEVLELYDEMYENSKER